MEKVTANLMTEKELENMTKDTLALDGATFAHRASVKALLERCKAELKKIDDTILEKVNHEKVKKELFYTVVFDRMDFNPDTMIEKFGKDAYESCKTKPVHTEYVRNR